MSRLLVVEDEEHLASGLKFNLEAEGYEVSVHDTGEAALAALTRDPSAVDLVLLDVMLPGIDGFEVIRALRHAGILVPVMMLTARGQKEDVLRGFELGADDYVAKPFDLPILIARIQGVLRRMSWREGTSGIASSLEQEPFTFSGRRIDFERRTLVRDGKEFSLTLMEAELLGYLVRHEGQNVDRQALLEDVWGVRRDTDTRTIDNFIARLRRVVEDDPSRPRHLQTVRGVGYRFVAEPDE